MVDINNLYSNISKLIFLIYLPFTFFVWYWMLDGFGGGINTILTISVFIFILVFIRYQKIDINSALFFCFFSYCLCYVLVYYVFIGDVIDFSNRSLFNYHIIGLLMYLISYLIGRNIVMPNERLLIVVFILMSLKVFLNADLSIYSIDLSSVDDEFKGLYLGLSDIFCIFALILLGVVKENWLKIIIFIISILTLFILNSRASLYIYIFSGLFYFIFFLRLSRVLLIFFVISIILIFYASEIISIFYENNRMFSALPFFGEDQSNKERLFLVDKGLNQIEGNVILGDYGGVIQLYGDLGAYIHNILSYWQNYGLVAFIFCAYFFLFQMFKSGILSYRVRFDKDYHYIFILSVYLVLTMLFARSYSWYFSWFILGVIHNFLFLKNKNINV